MFWSTRRRLEKIEESIEKVVERIEKLADEKPTNSGTGEVVATLLGKTLDNQASLVHEFGEIAVKSAARRLGIRGGKKRADGADRDKEGRFLRTKRISRDSCPLCENPMHRPVTIEMIQRHRQHEYEAMYGRRETSNNVEPDASRPADATANNGSGEPG